MTIRLLMLCWDWAIYMTYDIHTYIYIWHMSYIYIYVYIYMYTYIYIYVIYIYLLMLCWDWAKIGGFRASLTREPINTLQKIDRKIDREAYWSTWLWRERERERERAETLERHTGALDVEVFSNFSKASSCWKISQRTCTECILLLKNVFSY